MTTEITVKAEVRSSRGKNEARRTRVAGKIPAVIYGAEKDPVAISVNPKDILAIVHGTGGYNTIFTLEIEGGESTPVMVIDHQNEPIRNTLLHADLKRIDVNKRTRFTVPLVYTGESKGVKQQSGHFEVVARSVEIECLPTEIPKNFTIDITEMMVGQGKRASDLPLTGSMKLLSPADEVLAHVIALKAEAVAEPAAAATPEPEVVKKGKKEEAPADDKKKK